MPLLDRDMLKKTGIMSLASGLLLVSIGGGWWVGSWLDSKWNSAPVFSAVLAMLGLAFSGWRIWWLARDWMK